MTIRNVKEDEIEIIWQIICEESFGINEALLNQVYKDAYSFICFEDVRMGFAFSVKLEKGDYETGVYIAKSYRRQGYGKVLMAALEERITKSSGGSLIIENMIMYCDASAFLNKCGYKRWYSSSLMTYSGPAFEVSPLDLVPYSDDHYRRVSGLRTEAFYGLRKENDILPYAIEESDEEKAIMLKAKDLYQLYFDGENLIGVLKINNGFIDLLMVDKAYRGKGYGKKLLKYGTNIVFKKGYDCSSLYVMDTNKGARKLYESIGYQVTSTVEVYRKKY